MRKYLIAGLLTVAFVTPALAEDFYVAVDLATGRVTVDSGRELTPAEVTAAIDEAGYQLVS